MHVKYSRRFLMPSFFDFRRFSLVFSLADAHEQARPLAVTNKKLTALRRFDSCDKLLGVRVDIDVRRGEIGRAHV